MIVYIYFINVNQNNKSAKLNKKVLFPNFDMSNVHKLY